MGIRLGVIEYDRPSRPVKVDDVRQMLAVAGKDVIRLAWASLNPDSGNCVKREALATWFCEFFNLERDCGNGNRCTGLLCNMDLLERCCWDEEVKPKFDL